jgi:hypothetical protein
MKEKDKKHFLKLQEEGRFNCSYRPCEGEKICRLWEGCIQPQRIPIAKEKVKFS